MMMTKRQIDATASLVSALRPDWDVRGVMAALDSAQDRGGPFDVAMAAIRAAGMPTNLTPAVIGMRGPHWSGASVSQVVPEHPKPCPACMRIHAPSDGDDHPRRDAERNSRGVAAARAALTSPQ